jgi:hypothetical protein
VKIVLAVLGVFALLAGWLAVRRMAHDFAMRNRIAGPRREEGEGCGGCGCTSGDCKRDEGRGDSV